MASRLDNRPLLGTIDAPLFVAPSIMSKLRAAASRGLNVLVLGEPGFGKTTLLRAVDAELRESDESQRAVYVDLVPARTAEQALMLVAEALGERNAMQAWGDALSAGLVPPSSETRTLLRLVRRLADAPASLILADSPPGEGHSHMLFGRLRDELWRLPHRWIVAAHSGLRDELTRPPANAFFDVSLELAPLTEAQQRDLLRRRLVDEPGIDVDGLVGQADGSPRSLIALAREAVLSGESVDAVLARREGVRARLADLPPTARAITDYLEVHGPTSGSDPQLLGVLGVSGQRARHVLRELEAAGLVRAFAEQQERRGRPRKLYELVEKVET
jgi:hypothetical protein